jgi:hypothetical protein
VRAGGGVAAVRVLLARGVYSLDMSVMHDDIPGEAYTALVCFHRDLCLWNEGRRRK